MKLFHSITLKMFTKPEEDANLDDRLFNSLFPFDLAENKLRIEVEKATGFNDRKITIRTLRLEKDGIINEFIDHLKTKLSEHDLRCLREQEDRLDENLHFFLRLDKTSVLEGDWRLTDAGDCVHLDGVVAAFPKKRENALVLLKEIFK